MTSREYWSIEFHREDVADELGQHREDWVFRFPDGTLIVGVDAILNVAATHGWELLHLGVEDRRPSGKADSYRATFQRSRP